MPPHSPVECMCFYICIYILYYPAELKLLTKFLLQDNRVFFHLYSRSLTHSIFHLYSIILITSKKVKSSTIFRDGRGAFWYISHSRSSSFHGQLTKIVTWLQTSAPKGPKLRRKQFVTGECATCPLPLPGV